MFGLREKTGGKLVFFSVCVRKTSVRWFKMDFRRRGQAETRVEWVSRVTL